MWSGRVWAAPRTGVRAEACGPAGGGRAGRGGAGGGVLEVAGVAEEDQPAGGGGGGEDVREDHLAGFVDEEDVDPAPQFGAAPGEGGRADDLQGAGVERGEGGLDVG